MKHTKEPWFVKDIKTNIKPDYLAIEANRGTHIVATPDGSDGNCEENFHRIVECVNACYGMHNPAVVIGTMMDAIGMVLDASEDGGDMNDIDWNQLRDALAWVDNKNK